MSVVERARGPACNESHARDWLQEVGRCVRRPEAIVVDERFHGLERVLATALSGQVGAGNSFAQVQ